MKIVATSDLHGHLPDTPPCDLLLIAGDVCPVYDHTLPFQTQWLHGSFAQWLNAQPAEVIIGIGGNHDFALEQISGLGASLPWVYLDNETVRIDHHVIFGSPLTPTFLDWAFMQDDAALASTWALIPDDTTILMTHGPPDGCLDFGEYAQEHIGCRSLAARVPDLKKLRLHVFGHIHEGRGMERGDTGPIFANVAYLNLQYEPYVLPGSIEVPFREFDL